LVLGMLRALASLGRKFLNYSQNLAKLTTWLKKTVKPISLTFMILNQFHCNSTEWFDQHFLKPGQ